MNKQQFDKAFCQPNIKVIYQGEVRDVLAMDKQEQLLGLACEGDTDTRQFIRRENAQIIDTENVDVNLEHAEAV